MRIKQINIDRYGPLNQIFLPIGDGVQPIYGDNESGKTLLVDAVIKLLTGKSSGWDSSLDRVEEVPEGYLILDGDGEEIKIDRNNDLTSYLPLNADEVRNIFIIRNSDLNIPEEDRFYERIYDRLTGLRTNDIRIIIDKLIDIGRLTDTLKLSNAKNKDRAASNLKNARTLQRQIQKYLEESEEQGINELEAKIYNLESEIEKSNRELEQLKKAKEKEDYIALEDVLSEAEISYEALKNFPETDVLTQINLNIKSYLDDAADLPRFERISDMSKNVLYLLIIGTLLSWGVGIFWGTTLFSFVVPALFIFGSIASGYLWYANSIKISRVEGKKNEVVRLSKETGLKEEAIGAIKNEVDSLKEQMGNVRDTLQQNIGILNKSLNLDEKDAELVIEQSKRSLAELKREIDFDIRIEYDEELLDHYLQKEIELTERLKTLRNNLSEHNERLSEFSKKTQILDFNTFLGRPLNVEVSNLESLRMLMSELDPFIKKISTDEKCAVCASEIFRELEREETEKISDLFEEESITSDLFSRITKGRYSNVFYDNSEKKIIVERPSGQTLDATKLSRGAYDQLYFAIRIDLAQRMLEGRASFIILDDAFLSSGTERFEEGIAIMKQLSDKGWNLVYLTVKDRDADKIYKISGNELQTLNILP